jgi:anti-anti-sigma factor
VADVSRGSEGPAITVSLAAEGADSVVRVTGEVDIETSLALRTAILPVFEQPVPHTVIFDLGGVTFIDSAGLAVLISVARDGRSVRLRNPSAVFVRVLEATGLTQDFPVEP